MNQAINAYNGKLAGPDAEIGKALCRIISCSLPDAESRIWHGHPVWFLDGNPIAGYSKMKDGMRLLFWSGQSFKQPGLSPEGKFKAAGKRFHDLKEIDVEQLKNWLTEARFTQWDYKNIVKRKGVLEKLNIAEQPPDSQKLR